MYYRYINMEVHFFLRMIVKACDHFTLTLGEYWAFIECPLAKVGHLLVTVFIECDCLAVDSQCCADVTTSSNDITLTAEILNKVVNTIIIDHNNIDEPMTQPDRFNEVEIISKGKELNKKNDKSKHKRKHLKRKNVWQRG